MTWPLAAPRSTSPIAVMFSSAASMRATAAGEKSHGGLAEIERQFGNGAGHELSSKLGAAIKRSARVKSMHLPEESIRAMQRTLTLWQCGQRIGGAGGVAG